MKSKKECQGQCCLSLSEENAVYVEGITGTLRLCPLCASMLESLPPIPEGEKKEYQQQYRHFKETGEVVRIPTEQALKKRIQDLASTVGIKKPSSENLPLRNLALEILEGKEVTWSDAKAVLYPNGLPKHMR